MASIKKELATGVFYIGIAKYSGIIVQLIVTSILARLLTPSDFGIIAIATVFIIFFNLISDIGFGPAIIQRKDLLKGDLNNLFTLSIFLGVILSILFFVASNSIAAYYGQAELKEVCRWLCLLIVANSVNIVPNALLLRDKKFRFIAFRTLIVQIISGIGAIFTAWLGWGVYALILQSVLSNILLAGINYFYFPLCLQVRGYKETLPKIASFSVFQFLFNFVNYFSRNLDKILVGKYLSISALGYYEKSYRLMMLPLQNLTFVITPVMHPVFSELQNHPKELAAKYVQVLRILAYISIPLTVWLFFSARELVLIVFGEQWVEAILPFQVLSLSVFIQVLNSTTGSIFQSSNNTKALFWSGIYGAIFLLGSFFITIFVWGTLFAVSIGFDIAILFAALTSFHILFRKLGYPICSYLLELRKPFLLGIILFLILWVVNNFISENIYVSLVINLIVVLISTFLLVQLLGEYDLIKLIKQAKNRFHP